MFLIVRSLKSPGYTLNLALIILSVILGAALGISSFVYTQLVLSQEAGDSAKAITAAENGIEKILYQERKLCSPANPAMCLDVGGPPINIPFADNTCAKVLAEKRCVCGVCPSSDDSPADQLQIKSIGESRCNSDRAAKRAICVFYGFETGCDD